MDDLKQVIAEWVLTNGVLPGFDERVKQSLPLWNVVDEKGLIVYRAQGNSFVSKKGNGGPENLESGVRSVVASSHTLPSILRYSGPTCCIFQIHVSPGIRFLNVNSAVTFIDKTTGNHALAVKNDVLKRIQDICPTEGTFPSKDTSLRRMRSVIIERCAGRIKQFGTDNVEYIPPEHEIMLDGTQGTFQNKKEIDSYGGITVYSIDYVPRMRGRGRTFRRTSKRRNKNGRRSARQPQHGRNCNS